MAVVWSRPSFQLHARTLGHLLMVGLLIQTGYFAFTYLSLKLGMSAGGVALITSQQPILVGLLAPVIAQERVGVIRWCDLILGVLGAAIVLLSKSSLAMGSIWGLGFSCLALISMTGGVLLEKRFGVSALFFLVPPMTALIALVVLHETLSWIAIAGMALAGAGIYLVMRQPSAS